MYIENIVIGKPLIDPSNLLSLDKNDWKKVEKEKTYFTEERYLPRILVDIGIYPSTSEIRRNKPNLCINLNDIDYIDGLKVRKKRKVYIVVGE